MAERILSQVYGQVASIIVSQMRFKAVMLSLPLVALVPVYFAAVFGLSREDLLAVLIGALVSPAVWINLGMLQDIVYEREGYRYLEMLIASPMRPIVYVASRIIAGLTISLTTILPMALVYSYLTGDYKVTPMVLGLVLLLSMILAPLSMLIGLKLRSVKEAGSLPSLLGTLLVFLPPVYYEPSILPQWLQTPAVLVPPAAVAEALRSLTLDWYTPVIAADTIIAYLILAALASAMLLYARFNWSLE